MRYIFACANCGEVVKNMSFTEYEKFNNKCDCGFKLKRTYTSPSLTNVSTSGDVNAFREKLVEGINEQELDRFLSTDKGEKMAKAYVNLKKKEGDLVKERSAGIFDDIEADGRWAKSFAIDDETGKLYNPKEHGKS